MQNVKRTTPAWEQDEGQLNMTNKATKCSAAE